MGIARELAELGSAYNSGGINQSRNRIINGAMMIDQRNAGASVTPAASTYTLDRWRFGCPSAKISIQQNAGGVTPPSGFRNYIGATTTSAYTPSATDAFTIAQFIEGNNASDMMFGTASASTFTLSFWVRSSLTGIFGAAFCNENGGDRSYPFTYTINNANTWEQKTITVTGDTTGTWNTVNATGLGVIFCLGAGSNFVGTANTWQAGDKRTVSGATSVVGTNGATFYITGVQLEKGSTATSFDYRPYGTELALCQRYCFDAIGSSRGGNYYKVGVGGMNRSSLSSETNVPLPVTMRTASPTITWSGTWGLVYNGTSTASISNFASNAGVSTNQLCTVTITHSSGPSAGSYTFVEALNLPSNKFLIETEL